ncbi:MAG: MGMT family protein [Puniceicoccaceae bacterium]|nr:MAG: MGMT family protein [Puniceicoccaceae bacterium]
MARLNDNLFTNSPITFQLGTRFGPVRVRFSERGLAELVYLADGESCGSGGDAVPAVAFLEWVEAFSQADRETQWHLLDVVGSDFQRMVWRQLLEIPLGGSGSYGQIAGGIGRPSASRAVGSAVGANPVAVLLPCHRVLPQAGGLGNYLYGAERKRALLDAEQESGSALVHLFHQRAI